MLRVGIIGVGHNGLAHLEAHRHMGRSRIVAVCDRNPDLLAQAADRYDIPHRFTDAANLCARDDIDAVSINTGDPYHAEPFIAAVENGKHVLVEKPLANTLEQVEQIVAAARRADQSLKIAVGYILRFNSVIEAVHAACRDGTMGRIYYQEADYIHNLLFQAEQNDPHTGGNWYLQHEQPMVGGGSHPLDLMRWFSGGQVVEVCGYANHVAFEQMQNDDCQVALFRFDDGGIAKVASLYGPRRACPLLNNLRIYGTLGTIEQDRIAVARDDQDVHPEFEPIEAEHVSGHPYEPEVADWIDAIEQDRPPRCDLYDGANSTAATLVAVDAIAQGRALAVPVYRPPA